MHQRKVHKIGRPPPHQKKCVHQIAGRSCRTCFPHYCDIPGCPRAGKPFGGINNLRQHMKQVHQGQRRIHPRCPHGKVNKGCSICYPMYCCFEGCLWSTTPLAGAQSLLVHMRGMHSTEKKAVVRRKQLEVYLALQNAGVEFQHEFYLPFKGCGLQSDSSHAFVDFYIQKPTYHLFLEADENSHDHYDPSCDPRRDADIYASVALGSGGKVCVLRYNCDAWKVGGVTQMIPKRKRLERLVQLIKQLDKEPRPDLPFVRLFLYYPMDSLMDTLPSVAKEWVSDEMRKISAVVM